MEKSTVILVPTDFTPVAESAATHAAMLARKSGETVCLFHVIDKDTKSELKKNHETLAFLEDKLQRIATAFAAKYQVPVVAKLKEGNIFTTIGEMASELEASLIVMGTHGVQGIQHLVGAYALKVVASSKIPVIIVQEKLPHANGHQIIVSPIDSSVETKQKTIQTVHVAKMLNAKVYLYKQKGYDDYIEDHIKLNLNFVKRYLKEHNVDFEVAEQEKFTKNFSKDFIAYATKISADLILILTTNEKGLMEIIIGPEEQNVINNNSQIPVMCVNPLQAIYKFERLSSTVNLSF